MSLDNPIDRRGGSPRMLDNYAGPGCSSSCMVHGRGRIRDGRRGSSPCILNSRAGAGTGHSNINNVCYGRLSGVCRKIAWDICRVYKCS